MTTGALSVVNEIVSSAVGWSGGSSASPSPMGARSPTATQVVPCGRSAVGSSVIVAPGEPETPKARGVPLGHSRLKELVVAVTGLAEREG